MDLKLPALALLAFLQCLLRETFGFLDKAIKAIPVCFVAAITMTPLYSLDKSRSLHTRDVALNRPWLNADTIRQRLLRWEWKIVAFPPMIRELQQDIYIKRVQSQRLLALQKNRWKAYPAGVNQGLSPAVLQLA